jgi:hypothetical protein
MHEPGKPFDVTTLPESFVCPCGFRIPTETTHVVAARLTGRAAYLNGTHYCGPGCYREHVEREARRRRRGLDVVELRELARRL